MARAVRAREPLSQLVLDPVEDDSECLSRSARGRGRCVGGTRQVAPAASTRWPCAGRLTVSSAAPVWAAARTLGPYQAAAGTKICHSFRKQLLWGEVCTIGTKAPPELGQRPPTTSPPATPPQL